MLLIRLRYYLQNNVIMLLIRLIYHFTEEHYYVTYTINISFYRRTLLCYLYD